MKKLFIILLGITLAMPLLHSQTVRTWTENFDGNTVSFSSNPPTAWERDVNYYESPPYAYLGNVPNMPGGTAILETPPYNMGAYEFVYLRFKHICKVSPLDIVRIEYKISGQQWTPIPTTSYQGEATNYLTQGFNAASYPEWDVDDSTEIPTQSWWKTESFDVSFETKGDNAVQFRFIIQHGNTPGTQISYGWLLDDIEIIASTYEQKRPTVEFVIDIPDTVSVAGPFSIRAKVETQTAAPLETPYFKYTATKAGVVVGTDSVAMTSVATANSLWEAKIPQFSIGTTVVYSITAKDTNENEITISSKYLIGMLAGTDRTVIIGNGTTANYVLPIGLTAGYSWSRQLYLASEIDAANSLGGLITHIAWDYNSTITYTRYNQTCYLRAVDETILYTSSFNPLADGATQVWTGKINLIAGWCEIKLDDPFFLPAGKNLLVYWESKENGAGGVFRAHSSSANPSIYALDNGSGTTIAQRTNMRLQLEGAPTNANSVALRTIEIPDTVITASGMQYPVIANIKNKGTSDLDSVILSFSANGAAPVSKTWKGNLAWDNNVQDTIGNYYPRKNDYDTIKVWVSMPNGTADALLTDDTLTKIVFGSGDILMRFVDVPFETVSKPETFLISASITFLTGTVPDTIWLKLNITYNGNTTVDSLPMNFNNRNKLWTTEIPMFEYGTHVVYSISLIDIMNNLIEISGNYLVKRVTINEIADTYIFGDITGKPTFGNTVYLTDQKYSWTRFLYMADEISADKRDMNITKLAWYNPGTAVPTQTRTKFRVYMKTTSKEENSLTMTKLEAIEDGATRVYNGSTKPAIGWNEITLITPFLVPQGLNLLIYFEDSSNVSSTSNVVTWATSDSRVINIIQYSATGHIGFYFAPVLRFSLAGTCLLDSNSVALDKILPESKDIIPGSSNPIQAIIRNRGIKDLDSCTINWTLNGTTQTPYLWKGKLSEDYSTTVTLGAYTPAFADKDVVKVWVSMPNGITDATNSDDTLSVELFVCGNGISGEITVGSSVSADYPTIDAAFADIQTCGIDEKVTIKLETGTYNRTTYINMDALSNMELTDTLVLTSVTGKAEDVTIKTTAEVGLYFTNNRNITIQAITIDATAGKHAIQFIEYCTNIVIRDCHLLADPAATPGASTSAGKAVIYKYGTSSRKLEDIYIINNQINGGNYGICFADGYTAAYDALRNGKITVDSNTFSNNTTTAAYLLGVIHCTHNTIFSPTTNLSTTWKGIYGLHGWAEHRYVGNRIIQHCEDISTVYGIELFTAERNAPIDTPLIANNEIILSSSNCAQGIIFRYGKIFNNSIYISGDGTGVGTYGSVGIHAGIASVHGEIKNNNIVILAPSGAPYCSNTGVGISSMNIDYNNTYNLNDYMCSGTPTLTTEAWKSTILTDVHSTRILPNFIDATTSLKPSFTTNLLSPVINSVNEDIDGMQRTATTNKGCYEIAAAKANATLTAIEDLQEGLIAGQTDTVQVVLYNTGTDTLTSINLGWSINNITQNGNISLPVTLAQWESVTLELGTINYTAGNITVKAWINSLNNGGITDEYPIDDTITTSTYICTGTFRGLITIGATGDFPNFAEAYNALQLCGVGGDITMSFQPGTYTDIVDLTDNVNLFGNYFLTLTSVSGDTSDVILNVNRDVVILCNNTNNLIIRNITIDATKGTYPVQFTGAASNIMIDNCHILANPVTINYNSTTTTSGVGIYKLTNTGALSDLTVKNCIIEGGYSAIYLYGTAANYCQNITIDSNTIINQYYYGIYLYCVNASRLSYNRINPRTTAAGAVWYAAHGYYLKNSDIIGNRISSNNPAIASTLSGIYFNYMDTVLIANNEVYLNGDASTTNGIYVYYARGVKVINNTVYTVKAGTAGANYAHNNFIGSGYSSEIKNNIFAASGGAVGTTYAFYLSGSAADFTNYGSNYDIDYNDYYSNGTNIGFAAGSNRTDLAAWKTAISPLDQNSVNVYPKFANPSNGLSLASYSDSLLVTRWGNVVKDIRNIDRPLSTLMGAYTQFTIGLDLALAEFSSWNPNVIDKQTVPLNVILRNNGTTSITNIELGWSLNGGTPTTFSQTLTSSLDSLEERIINIGSFPVSNSTQNYNVVVWVSKVNGQADTVKWNDTLRASASLNTLAEFVAIPVDTITDLSFDIYARINSQSGATINTPKMTIVSTIHGGTTPVYDTVPMLLNNSGLWQAVIPRQYYGTKVIYSLTLSDTVQNNITLTDSTYIRSALSILGDPALVASMELAEPLNTTGCMPDYTPVKISLANLGTKDYDFAKDTILFGLEIIDADTILHTFSVPFEGILESGTNIIELLSSFPTIHPGAYYIKSWIGSSTDNTPYMDTLNYTYISGKIGLPIDEYFNSSIPLEFDVWGNSSNLWTIIPQGTGADTVVKPVFGNGMASFTGSRGAISTLTTRQMDLSRTIDPTLSFWYFHDTVPSKDYTDVRLTVDGRITHTTLLSLTKYDTVYGWKQYDVTLPPVAVNSCVMLVFEAMEKSLNGDVVQYIDRIRITAKQDIAVDEIILPELTVCGLKNNELKVVLRNLTDPSLNFATTPVIVNLEVKETGQIFADTLKSGYLGSLALDTVTLTTDFHFNKGTYTFKACFSSVQDVDRQNDTLETSIIVNPDMDVQIVPITGGNTNCITGETDIYPSIVITNTGNMDLSDISLVFQVDTGSNTISTYSIFKEICTDTILAGESFTYNFKTAYETPWLADYQSRVTAYLSCDSSLLTAITALTECVDIRDLYMVNIDAPVFVTDTIGNTVQIKATVGNHSDMYSFSGIDITFRVENSQGELIKTSTEATGTIAPLSTTSHVFTNTYTVPNDSEYYLSVYVSSSDSYSRNDTTKIKRTAKDVNKDLEVISIDQPSSDRDSIGSSVQVIATIVNHSEYTAFYGTKITVVVENSQRIQTAKFIDTIGTIGTSATVNHTFSQSYIVPNDSIYYLTVYIDSSDEYPNNDTMSIKRETRKEGIGIFSAESIKGLYLGQNIPNPATNSTRIDYSIPEAGEVIFHVHSISGQLLYSKTTGASRGTNSIELNTSTFAAGVYFYSMEYKGQKLVKQLIINATN